MTEEAAVPVPVVSTAAKVLDMAKQPGVEEVVTDAKDGLGLVQAAYLKSGFKSSEFLLTLLFVLGAFGFVGVQLYQGKTDLVTAGALLTAALKIMAYNKGRVSLKQSQAGAGASS